MEIQDREIQDREIQDREIQDQEIQDREIQDLESPGSGNPGSRKSWINKLQDSNSGKRQDPLDRLAGDPGSETSWKSPGSLRSPAGVRSQESRIGKLQDGN